MAAALAEVDEFRSAQQIHQYLTEGVGEDFWPSLALWGGLVMPSGNAAVNGIPVTVVWPDGADRPRQHPARCDQGVCPLRL